MSTRPTSPVTPPHPPARPRTVHVAVAVTMVGFGIALLVAPTSFARDVVTSAVTFAPMMTLAVVLARRTLPEPRPWIAIFAGLVVMCAYSVVWMLEVHLWGLAPPSTLVTTFGMPVGYLGLLLGGLLLLARATRRNAGAVVDAALIALSLSLLVWMLVVAPRVAETGVSAARTMIILVVLGGLVGALVRSRTLARQRRASMTYLTVVVVSTLVGTIAREATVTAQAPGGAWWVGLLWIVSYVTLIGAFAHPSARAPVTEVAHAGRLTRLRVLMLGGSIAIGPTALLVGAVTGTGEHAALVATVNLAIVPLVTIRVAQLTRLHAGAERRLGHLATHDPLTGLPNRRALSTHLARALDRVRTGTSAGVVVLFCDLDGFKAVNDSLGHRGGDELLVAVAGRLAGCVRTCGRGDADDLVVRFAGDEFVVVVEASPDVAESVAGRVRAALADDVVVAGRTLPVSASIGIATAGPDDDVDVDELLSAADARMYERKRHRSPADADRPSPSAPISS